jgi:ATP-dependent Clp protease ATP-binding subunit ClpC
MDETIEILHNIKDRYEDHHNVTYTEDAIQACVKLTTRYISDRHLPDKAIDALDESGSRVHISRIKIPEKIEQIEKQIEEVKKEKLAAVKNQQFELAASHRDQEQVLIKKLEEEKINWEKELSNNREVVDVGNVEEVVAMMTGVPVQRIAQTEGNRLLKMKDELVGKVVGQDDAIIKIVKAIQTKQGWLKRSTPAYWFFYFPWPHRCWKNPTCKNPLQLFVDSEDALVRVDMSEYMEKFSVSRSGWCPSGIHWL